MAEIKLQKRAVYAGDVHIALLKAGWSIADATKFVRELPTAEVEPVTFTKFNHCRGKMVCGNCGWTFAWSEPEMPYCCPFCGARMDLGGTENA